VFATLFDVSRLEVNGTPAPVLEDVAYNSLTGASQFDVSRRGTLVYRAGSAAGLVSLQWLDADGKTEPLPARPAGYAQPHLAPDGKRLAVSITGGGGQDIWVYDWQRDAMSRLTSAGGTYVFPVWTPDGRYIVFSGGFGRGGLLSMRADGSGRAQALLQSKNGQFAWSFSRDGKRLAYADFPVPGNGDIWTVPIESDGNGLKAGKPEVFLQTPSNELYPAFSPDGRWIAYRTNESGMSEIEVRPFPPDKGGKWVISNSGGVVPVWSPNGRELFYRTEDQRIMVVTYTVQGDAFVADKPRLWVQKRLSDTLGRNLDITADGKRFVALLPFDAAQEQQTLSHVVFLENFVDEVRRRIGPAK